MDDKGAAGKEEKASGASVSKKRNTAYGSYLVGGSIMGFSNGRKQSILKRVDICQTDQTNEDGRTTVFNPF